MDKSKPIATFKQSDIIKYLWKHPELMDDKKMHELVIGWLLIQFLSDKEKKEMYIGFPLKTDWENRCNHNSTSLEMLLKNSDKLLEDRDIDIFVGKEKYWLRCQVTRYVNHPMSKNNKKLYELIAKKCHRVQPDNSLILIINIESKPKITIDELKDLINIPFGQILLIGKASHERGHFSLSQLYPKPVIGKEIRVPLLV